MAGELDVVLGDINVHLEGRFSHIRTQETNLGNFVCDILMNSVCIFFYHIIKIKIYLFICFERYMLIAP
jgi:hypothetical protein